MKFLYSDTHDYVDPGYNFQTDRNAAQRKRYWDDAYAHELMRPAPYDGLLVAMSAVVRAKGIPTSKARYSTAETHRLIRDGARKFLRMNANDMRDAMLMGDCGAFAYADLDEPAFSPEQVCEFYTDVAFSHGISPDHIVFQCDQSNPSRAAVDEKTQYRYDLTLENAEKFLTLCHKEGEPFEPVGAVQGWSPKSMAEAATQLQRMGYRYLAIGGLVPLKAPEIHGVLQAIRKAIKPDTKLHLLGFAKAESIHEFVRYHVSSFDSTSPLIRAFKDAKANYYLPAPDGSLSYYAAIRIPQATVNSRLKNGAKSGAFSQEDLLEREEKALGSLRAYDKGKATLQTTLDNVTDYQSFLLRDGNKVNEKDLVKAREQNARTLRDKPWKHCKCAICEDIGVDVIIFRSSNHNKRRGFHNLGVYHQHLQRTLESQP